MDFLLIAYMPINNNKWLLIEHSHKLQVMNLPTDHQTMFGDRDQLDVQNSITRLLSPNIF